MRQHGEALAARLGALEDLGQLGGEQRAVGQIGQRIVMGKMGDLLVAGKQLGARRAHVLARLVEAEGRVAHLLLQQVEAVGHLAQLVARVGLHRHDVDRGVRRIEVAASERAHGEREVAQRAPRQALGGRAHLLRRVGDHARQDEADADGQQGDGDEDVLQHGDELACARRHGVDGHEIGDAVEDQHEQHGAGELDVQRLGEHAAGPAAAGPRSRARHRGRRRSRRARGRTGRSAGRTAGSREWPTAARSRRRPRRA